MTIANYSKYSVLMSRLKDQSLDIKIRAIQVLLLSELRYLDREELALLINKLLEGEVSDYGCLEQEIKNHKDIVQPLLTRLEKKIDALTDMVGISKSSLGNVSEKLTFLVSQVNEIRQRILEAGRSYEKKCNSVEEALKNITEYSELNNTAMNKAAEIIIQRMIESFNPDDLENHIDNSVIKVGPLKKAAMFDAMKDKYEQISMYQKEGKMLRDFKVHYKSELKSLKKNDLN